jgi:hypothetical protein
MFVVSMAGRIVSERIVRVGAAAETGNFERRVPAIMYAKHGPERQHETEHECREADGA